MRPSILIVTPTLGRSPMLSATIASVRVFHRQADHLLIAPGEQVPALERDYPDAWVMAEPPEVKGIYPALQAAFDGPGRQYEWLGWINDDDVLEAGFERVIARAGSDAGLDLIYGKVRMITAEGSHLMYAPAARSAALARLCARVGQVPFTQQGGLMRRRAFERCQGFSTRYKLGADSDLFFRILNGGARSWYCSALVASYRIVAGQLSADGARQRAEHADMIETLSGSGWLMRRIARAWFLVENAFFLIERVRRHGFVSVRTVMGTRYQS